MNKLAISLLVISCSFALAGDREISLNLSSSQGRSYAEGPSPSTQFTVDPKNALSVGLRFGYEFSAIGSAKLIAQATIHSESTTDFHFVQNGFNYSEGNGKYKNQGISIGLNARWQKLFEYGFGTEVRYEHLELVNTDTTAGQFRPWLNLYSGLTIKYRSYTPFLGLEFAAPITHSSYTPYQSTPSEFLKSMSPKYEISLIFGIRK